MSLAYDAPRSGADRARSGMYESHYVKAADPAGGRAVWLRHTVLSRPDGGGQRTTTWLTVFDRDADAPVAQRRVTDEAGYTSPPAAGWSACACGTLGPQGADGAMEDATWSLRWQPVDGEPVPYLPKRWLYDRPIPRSNGVALLPFGRMSGRVEVAGRTLELDGWPGMVGHNWGSDHAAHWLWMHAAGVGAGAGGWFDGALARVPTVGDHLSGWLATGAVMLDGSRRRVSLRGAELEVGQDGEDVRVRVGVEGGRLDVHATLPPAQTVRWDYAAPHGPGRSVRNCSIASARVVLTTKRATTELELDGTLALELGVPQ